MNIRFIALLVSLFLSTLIAHAQTEYSYYEEDSVSAFTDGFYKSIADFEANKPIRPEQIITDVKLIDPRFFQLVLEKSSFRYRENDSIKSVAVDELFGYTKNGDPYMNVGNGDFSRMATVGSICFIPVKKTPQVSPSVGFGASSWGGAGMGVGINISPPPGPSEIILLVSEGKSAELSTETLLEFMAADSQLVQQYEALKKREQRKQQFQYIQLYNQRNPLR